MPEKFHESPGFFGAVKPLRFEADVFEAEVIGEIPKEINGRLYRCGPVRFLPSLENDNILNGDGLVSMFHIADGHADFSCRFVRTERFELERAARKRLFGHYRNAYTDDPSVAGTDRNNTANTNAVVHAGRLFALREDSRPYELDPYTLATIGPFDCGGRLKSKGMSAHPKFDPVTGEWWSFCFFADGDLVNGKMALQVLDAAGELVREDVFDAPFPGLSHDFAVTREHVIFQVMPLTVDIDRVKAGGDFYAYDGTVPCMFGIMPRAGSVRDIRWFAKPGAFSGHIMNGYTEGDKVYVDATISNGNGFPFFRDVNGEVTPQSDAVATVSRLTFDLAANSADYTVTPFPGAIGELPRCDDRYMMQRYRYGYMMQPGGIGRLDWETGQLSTHALNGAAAGEPVFVPRSPDAPEGDGYVLAIVNRFAENVADLVILDANSMESDPLAIVKLPFTAPKAFHGSWARL